MAAALRGIVREPRLSKEHSFPLWENSFCREWRESGRFRLSSVPVRGKFSPTGQHPVLKTPTVLLQPLDFAMNPRGVKRRDIGAGIAEPGTDLFQKYLV
jgi:hypothetical protein